MALGALRHGLTVARAVGSGHCATCGRRPSQAPPLCPPGRKVADIGDSRKAHVEEDGAVFSALGHPPLGCQAGRRGLLLRHGLEGRGSLDLGAERFGTRR